MDDAAPITRRKRTRAKAPTNSDPIDIAMEAEAADERPDSPARRLLIDQGRLVRLEIADKRAGLVLKVLIAGAGLLLAAAVGWACWDASRATGTVIEPFDSAPSLVAQGLDGQAIASQLVSRLTAMQMSAGSDRPRRQSSSGGDRINLVIPQTGVSIGEAQRLLRGWLGDETHVSGALRPTPDGKLALSLRIDGHEVRITPPAPDQQGSADAWISSGAEAALHETDPYRYGTWLGNHGRLDEAATVYRRLMKFGSPTERAWAWIGLGTVYRGQGDLAGAVTATGTALRLAPRLDAALIEMVSNQRALGHAELARFYAQEAWRVDRQDAKQRATRAVSAASLRNDWTEAATQFETVMRLSKEGDGYAPGYQYIYGRTLARLHEPERGIQFTLDLEPRAALQTFDMRAWQLAEAERWPELEALANQSLQFGPGNEALVPQVDRVMRLPWLAYAMARNGQAGEARAIIGGTPLDCYFCVWTRGIVAAAAGEPAEADHWFGEAVRQGPSVADADYEWAQARLARGDVNGAHALAGQAARKAPGWADPLKLQGDIHARQGDLDGAVRLYAAAELKAPRWGGLRLAHGEALARLGKRPAALAQWREAEPMELLPAERTRLEALLSKRAPA